MAVETKPINEKENSVQEFTVHFWSDRVSIDGKVLPMGQVSTDVLNLTDDLLLDLRSKANEMLKVMKTELFNPEIKKDLALVSAVQEKLNEVLDIVLTLPLFGHLDEDLNLTLSLLPTVYAESSEEFRRMLLPETVLFIGLLKKLAMISDELHAFRAYVPTNLSKLITRSAT